MIGAAFDDGVEVPKCLAAESLREGCQGPTLSIRENDTPTGKSATQRTILRLQVFDLSGGLSFQPGRNASGEKRNEIIDRESHQIMPAASPPKWQSEFSNITAWAARTAIGDARHARGHCRRHRGIFLSHDGCSLAGMLPDRT